jgi:ABC-type sugar transport system ATPase subunit
MSVANQQFVQIARAVSQGAEILIFDEPTACLTMKETERLLNLIKQFRIDGKTIIFVSHHLDEVIQLSDRVVIMRDGCLIEVLEKEQFDTQRLINGMVGREVKQNVILRCDVETSKELLQVKELCRKKEFEKISFSVRQGEIFGVAGLVGAGRTELVSTIFGERKADSGEVIFDGEKAIFKEPKQAIAAGMGYVPEERRNYGILPSLNIRENLTIAGLARLFRFPVIDRKKEKELVATYTQKVRVKMANSEGLLTQLSGGNQQKVILARWLSMNCKLLILDEPTRGIDVLAKEEIHHLIRECADQGMTVLVVSSEMEELIQICNRILIMHEGYQKGIVEAKEITAENILKMALE